MTAGPGTTTVQEAMRLVGSGSTIVASGGCGTPETLLAGLGVRASAVGAVTLWSGIQLGAYPFLDAVYAGDLRYRTWHLARPIRHAAASGVIDYVPARASEVPVLLRASRPDIALVRVTPPNSAGYCSLGPSVGYALPAARLAALTIAEVDDDLPWTHGDSVLHVRDIDAIVPSEQATCEYQQSPPSAVARAVAAHVAALLPQHPTIQIGIGAVPEALTSLLADLDLGRVRFVGMGTDGMVDLFEVGVVDGGAVVPNPGLTSPELMGTQRLLRFAHDNPAIGMYPSTRAHDPGLVGAVDRVVSINSAICVDMSGQACSEKFDDAPAGAVGGSCDYAEAAYASDGGIRVIALASTAAAGTVSRIVPALDATRPVTIPRHSVDAVVTEHGVAWLRGRSIRERSAALLAIADPRHRDELVTEAS